MKLEPKESWSLVGGSSTHVSMIVHQKCHGRPHCQLQEEAERAETLCCPSPHLKFQINKHSPQKGEFFAVTHRIIIFCL